MKLSKNVFLSCEILAAHRLRTGLSVLGIVVGIAAVVLMVSVGKGTEKEIVDRIKGMGTNLIVVNAGQTRIVAGRERQLNTVTTLLPGDAEAVVQECPSVALAAPVAKKKLPARWESETTNTLVMGTTPDGFDIRSITAVSGRLFDAEECRGRRRVAVLGPTAARNLFGYNDPIGQRIRIGRVPFEVVGVTSPKGVDVNGMDQDDLILVPLQTAMRRLLNVTHVETVYVQARTSEVLDRAEDEIGALLRERHRLAGKPDDFTIQNQATLLRTEHETTHALTLLIGSVAGISLLVGGVGILAVMLISVHERTNEIGLRRAVGALRRDIRNQFLFESAMLAVAGGLLGTVTGVIAVLSVSGLGYAQAIVSWRAVAVSLGFSVVVGVVFGVYPAVRAARLEPIEALRVE
jgi:putative ABC transport system permease protein